ncbi:alpha-adducin isoform X5 [Scyliorhinus canicula]|uniref:alpha-adducin isoform X5 n=1 Tax=Scyliorhinus canicula TaxID=7830 RepID=UPI0018F499FE|nr:alpha-adducin isoform X5 [Scyliorhinus canicula]
MNGDSGVGVVTSPPPSTAPHKEKYFDRVDENNPEYLRERNMPPDLRQDFNMMEQRKRVSMILQSPAFCEELESMIQEQLKKGKNPTSLLALQQIADFMTTNVPSMYPAAPQGGMAALNMSLGMVTPVNDLRGSESVAYEKGEKLLRCKLAAFHRLADLFGWSQLIYNHITVRVSSEQEHFLIVPFGLLYSEVTASSLVKVNLQGDIIDRGCTNLGINQAGFTLHSAIYATRPDIRCIVHIHTPAGAAVSAMKCGLLPISPEALTLGEIAYHDYHGIIVDEGEKILIQKNLGPKNKVLILRNHGLVAVGETIEEAFYYIHNLVVACEIQVRTMASAGGPDNLVLLDPVKYKARSRCPESSGGDENSLHPKWLIGEQEFEALMRMLDNLGYRTGYPYRCPALREKNKNRSDVEIPPSATGFTFPEDSDSSSRSPLKQSSQKQQREKTRWLNAGSTGRVDEVPEESRNGDSPKSKTKVWTNITHDHVKPLLQSLSSGVCVPSCISNCLWTKESAGPIPNQFVPLNTDPREFKEMRNKIREQNLQDIKTAGPQSQLLCGVVLDRSFAQGELVTASKAIIEKEYQPRVIVSTAPNPFNKLTDRELDEYRKEVERKQKGPEAENTTAQIGEVLAKVEFIQVHPDGKPDGMAHISQIHPVLEQVTVTEVVQSQSLPSMLGPIHNQDNTTETISHSIQGFSTKADSHCSHKQMSAQDTPYSVGQVSGQFNPEHMDSKESLHSQLHSAVVKALASSGDRIPSSDLSDLSEPQLVEVKVNDQQSHADHMPTRTPPSTPTKLDDELQVEQTCKDDSAATFQQSLPELTPDEPSEVLTFPTSGNEESDSPSKDLSRKLDELTTAELQEVPSPPPPEQVPTSPAEEVADAASDESPSKSPSKKKKKFRTPSFLKKNKKKSDS